MSTKPSLAPKKKQVKKGDLLFKDGDPAGAMYLIQNGIFRIFKKRGQSAIELETIRSGQILGELAFLDGKPRSASAQALTEAMVTEISSPLFKHTLEKLPGWLKILLLTIVTRLRNASNRIRQLESSAIEYRFNREGKRVAQHVFLSAHDALKVSCAILLTASYQGKSCEKGIQLPSLTLQRFANQILKVPNSKITAFLDVFSKTGVLAFEDETQIGDPYLIDRPFLESFLFYLNERNQTPPEKQVHLSTQAFLLMSFILKNLQNNSETSIPEENPKINIGEIQQTETQRLGKEPFRLEHLEEIIKIGLASAPSMKSQTEIWTQIPLKKFKKFYKYQRLLKYIEAANE